MLLNFITIKKEFIFKILSMIEEAAGTKMYESKKQSALRTMEKKESKLTELEKANNICDFQLYFPLT